MDAQSRLEPVSCWPLQRVEGLEERPKAPQKTGVINQSEHAAGEEEKTDVRERCTQLARGVSILLRVLALREQR